MRVDVNRQLEVGGDRLKPEIPSPKGRVKPLFWTSKWLSERRIEGGNYEVERLVDHPRALAPEEKKTKKKTHSRKK